MKRMRIPLLIVLGVAIIGIILGSFFDLQISKAIANPNNYFALTVSAIGPTIGFAAVAAMGGGFIAYAVHGKYHIALKILFYVLAAACFGVAIFYPGGEYFGINGFYHAAPKWLGYIIVLFPESAAMFGGYLLFKECSNKNMWIVFCVVIGLLLIALLALIPTLKSAIHRPRFRFISQYDTDELFHNWWEPCKNYEALKSLYHQENDNFKSYPSGHSAEASILLVAFTFLPLADRRLEKIQLPLFLGGCALVLLVAFSRILAAAHFLSDVSWGITIPVALVTIANEVVMRIKFVQPPEEA